MHRASDGGNASGVASPDVRVLLVDDDSVVAAIVRVLLAHEPGLRLVHAAATVEQALSFLSGNQVDLVLLDHDLPDGDGGEVLRHLRDVQPDARVVLHTARGDAAARHEELGTDGVAHEGEDWLALVCQLRSLRD